MKGYVIILSLLALVYSSCAEKRLIKYDIVKEKSFYYGLYEVSIYKCDKNIDSEALINYPKYRKKYSEGYMTLAWEKFDDNLELNIDEIENQIMIAKLLPRLKEETNYLENLLNSIKFNSKDYYISGIYQIMKAPGNKNRRLIRECLILDQNERVIIKFTLKD